MMKTYSPRKKSQAPVHCLFCYFYDDVLAKGTIWDLSETGCRATGERPVATGSELTLYLSLPDNGKSKTSSSMPPSCGGLKGQDAGWEITRIDEEARARLDHFLENLNAPDVVAETKERTHSW